MIQVDIQEAIAHLLGCCRNAAAVFETMAGRVRLSALRQGLQRRAAHCEQVALALDGLAQPGPADGSNCRFSAEVSPGADDDMAFFSAYEVMEGRTLAAFRDVLELLPAPALRTVLVSEFEKALNQYVQLISLRPVLMAMRRPEPISPVVHDHLVVAA